MRGVGSDCGIEFHRVRISVASMAAWFALVRVEEAFANESDESVPHLAAANPDHAAMIATSESSTASAIETKRSRRE